MAPVDIRGCLWPVQVLASKLLCRQKGCGQSVEVTIIQLASCIPDTERHFPAESEAEPELPGALPASAGVLAGVCRGMENCVGCLF